jgi:hypothetical protein
MPRTFPFLTRDEFDGYVEQALSRMDSKGESPAEAAEAVTGGNRELDALIVRALQGASYSTLFREGS